MTGAVAAGTAGRTAEVAAAGTGEDGEEKMARTVEIGEGTSQNWSRCQARCLGKVGAGGGGWPWGKGEQVGFFTSESRCRQ